jgi:hypothetical protein
MVQEKLSSKMNQRKLDEEVDSETPDGAGGDDFDASAFLDNLDLNELIADPLKPRFQLIYNVEYILLRFLYDRLYELGMKNEHKPILTSFGNQLFTPRC